MTDAEKIRNVRARVGGGSDASDEAILVYLDDARAEMLRYMYPFGVPARLSAPPDAYDDVQCRLAARYFLRVGAEGETRHVENGIDRTYGSVDDRDLLSLLPTRNARLI